MPARGVDRQFHVAPDDVELVGDGIDATRTALHVMDEFGAARPFATGAIQLPLVDPGKSFVGAVPRGRPRLPGPTHPTPG